MQLGYMERIMRSMNFLNTAYYIHVQILTFIFGVGAAQQEDVAMLEHEKVDVEESPGDVDVDEGLPDAFWIALVADALG